MIDSISVTWTTEDIQDRADVIGIKITLIQAIGVLHYLKINHDANVGINWSVIDDAIRSL
jgi:uncharacterized membrane protein